MVKDLIRIRDRGSYGTKRWFVEYAPWNGRVKTLTLQGQTEFETRKEAQNAIKRAGGANKLKRKHRMKP